MAKPTTIALSLLSGAEGLHAFSSFNPSIFTIKSLVVPEGRCDQIRRGSAIAFCFSCMIGGIVSLLTEEKGWEKWLPLMMSAGFGALMWAVYEAHCRGPANPAESTRKPWQMVPNQRHPNLGGVTNG